MDINRRGRTNTLPGCAWGARESELERELSSRAE
jgi:hypothetical protein